MPGNRERMNQTNREQVLSSDLNRIGKLAGMEQENAAQLRSVRADFYNPATGAFDDFSTANRALQAVPISGLTQPPSLDGQAISFDMKLGAGEGEVAVTTPDDADSSTYQLCRWAAQTVTWPSAAQPDSSQAKVCLIIATPGDTLIDQQSRNILVDPNARTVSPANDYKTSIPQATISVLAGTVAGSPVPPSCPPGSLPLFEVWVPAGVASSSLFTWCRRSWRRIDFPGSSQHGILHDCVPNLSGGSPMLQTLSRVHRVVIDGELLTFGGGLALALNPDATSGGTPSSAPAGNDLPTYLYLCGGRNGPARTLTLALMPVVLVESLTPPDSMGYPTASLSISSPATTFPRSACCYIGVRFRKAGSSLNVPSFYAGDWIYSANTPAGGSIAHCFVEPTITGPQTTLAFTLASMPAVSTSVLLGGLCSGSTGSVTVVDANGLLWVVVLPAFTAAPVYVPGTGLAATLPGSSQYIPSPVAYNMNIPRLGR